MRFMPITVHDGVCDTAERNGSGRKKFEKSSRPGDFDYIVYETTDVGHPFSIKNM